MTIKQMQYFLSVAKTSNLTKSSKELFISQPALSLTIKQLEDEVGLPLFYKRGNRLYLTESGMILREEIEKIMRQYQEMEDRIHSGGMNRNYLRLGFSSFVGNAVVPQLCGAFMKRYPEVSLRTVESVGPTLLHMLENDQVDVVVTGGRYSKETDWKEKFHEIDLRAFDFSYFVSKDSPLAQMDIVTLDDIAAYPTVMLNDAFPITTRLKNLFQKKEKKLNIIIQTGQNYTVECFVSEGIAGGFLPTNAGRRNNSIVAVKCPELANFDPLNTKLYWKNPLRQYPSIQKLVEISREFSKEAETN